MDVSVTNSLQRWVTGWWHISIGWQVAIEIGELVAIATEVGLALLRVRVEHDVEVTHLVIMS